MEESSRRLQGNCDPVDSLTASVLVDQEYVITNLKTDYEFERFLVDPQECEIKYAVDTGDLEVVTFDPLLPKLSFFYKDDLDYCGDVSKDY